MTNKLRAGVIALGGILSASFIMISVLANDLPAVKVDAIGAESRELVRTISTTGTVESRNSSAIYSFLPAKINDVLVEVGDTVAAGDVLAQIDTEELEITIAQQKASINTAASQTGHQANVAAGSLSNAEMLLAEGYNMNIIQAQAQLDSATTALDTAILGHKNAEDAHNGKTSIPYVPVAPGISGVATVPETTDKTSTNAALEQAEITLRQARNTHATAKRTLEATLKNSNIEIETYENSLKGAKLGNNYSAQWLGVKQLELQLEQACVKAPQDGVVTAVYAKRGASGQGLLFVVEAIDDLKITTTVKDYDLASVSEGQKVEIHSDATGDAVISGTIKSIAPAAVKGTMGEVLSISNANFETVVEVSEANSGLRVGTSARMDIVVESKENALSIPFDAIATNVDGKDVIYTIVEDEKGRFHAKEVLVQIGVETEFYAEILNTEITADVLIISNAEEIEADGQEVVLN